MKAPELLTGAAALACRKGFPVDRYGAGDEVQPGPWDLEANSFLWAPAPSCRGASWGRGCFWSQLHSCYLWGASPTPACLRAPQTELGTLLPAGFVLGLFSCRRVSDLRGLSMPLIAPV